MLERLAGLHRFYRQSLTRERGPKLGGRGGKSLKEYCDSVRRTRFYKKMRRISGKAVFRECALSFYKSASHSITIFLRDLLYPDHLKQSAPRSLIPALSKDRAILSLRHGPVRFLQELRCSQIVIGTGGGLLFSMTMPYLLHHPPS